jgi:rhamnogalacturonyl hydrolase YesR
MQRIVIPTALLAAALAMTGCDSKLLDVPTPPDADLQAGIVASRYMAGGYSGAIDSTRDDPFIVYHWKYTQGVALWSLLLLHDETGNPAYLAQVEASLASYDRHNRLRFDGGSEPIDYIGAMAHAVLEYCLRSADQQLMDKALEAARYFHEDVARTPEGLIAHHSDPDGGRIWVDALFMVAPLMVKAGALLDDDSYYDDVLAQFEGFTEKLRDPTVGLYHQGWGWDGPGASPGFWGRANGWMAAAMTEALDTIPEGYPGREDLLTLYQEFAAAIVAHQGPGGMWHQLLDRHDSYEETSCTGLFIYALATGVQRGWLPDDYSGAIRNAHRGLSRMISLNGNIDNISPGCSTKSSEQGYLDKGPRRNGSHGIGPVMLALYSLM